MTTRIVTICNTKGLHARAAAKFVKCAGEYEAQILVRRWPPQEPDSLSEEEESQVNACSILGLMMLGAGIGTQLELDAQGADAETALAALEKLIAERFGEES
jgi:phosphocarrier protein